MQELEYLGSRTILGERSIQEGLRDRLGRQFIQWRTETGGVSQLQTINKAEDVREEGVYIYIIGEQDFLEANFNDLPLLADSDDYYSHSPR